jgi:hypothetical protein
MYDLPDETETGLYRYPDGRVIYLVPSNLKWRANFANGQPVLNGNGLPWMFNSPNDAALALKFMTYERQQKVLRSR